MITSRLFLVGSVVASLGLACAETFAAGKPKPTIPVYVRNAYRKPTIYQILDVNKGEIYTEALAPQGFVKIEFKTDRSGRQATIMYRVDGKIRWSQAYKRGEGETVEMRPR